MTSHRRGSAGRTRHSSGSRRSPDDIKERLRASLQKAKSETFSPGAVRDACKDAGLDDATATRFNDMALYAAYAVNASVQQSGQSAFSWIPLQGIVQSAVKAVPEDGRDAFTQRFITAVTRLLKHVEGQGSLKDIEGPPDLEEGSTVINNVMSSTTKVLRLAISGSGPGRAKSLRATADSVSKTVEAMQPSSGTDHQQGGKAGLWEFQQVDEAQRPQCLQIEQPYSRLRLELAAAKKLESRAGQDLDAARPGQDISPSLKAAAEAVYAYQGPELQKDIAELQRGILDAQQVLDTATEHLKRLNVDVEQIPKEADHTAHKHTARRNTHGRRSETALQSIRNGLEDEAFGAAAGDADVDDPEESELAAEQSQEGNAPASRARRPRKAHRDRDRRRRRRGLVDGTQRREEATDIEEEEEEDHQEGIGTPSAAGAHAGSSMPAVATSPRSSLAEPPGFSPVRNVAKTEQDGAPQEIGGRPRRPKKRSGRREKERQARRSLAAAREQEAGSPLPSTAFGEGFDIHDNSQPWAEVAMREESKPQRSRQERRRRQKATEDEAPDLAQPPAEAEHPEQTKTDQQVPRNRRAKISKLRTVAGTLLDLQNDITDPITQAPLVDPVVAADGYTYERSSIQKHLASSRISPISGKPMSDALYDNKLVASLLTRLNELPQLST